MLDLTYCHSNESRRPSDGLLLCVTSARYKRLLLNLSQSMAFLDIDVDRN